jgi:hypothetical protein
MYWIDTARAQIRQLNVRGSGGANLVFFAG